MQNFQRETKVTLSSYCIMCRSCIRMCHTHRKQRIRATSNLFTRTILFVASSKKKESRQARESRQLPPPCVFHSYGNPSTTATPARRFHSFISLSSILPSPSTVCLCHIPYLLSMSLFLLFLFPWQRLLSIFCLTS